MIRPKLLIVSFSDLSADARVLKQIALFAVRYDVTTYGYGPNPHPGVRHIQLDGMHGIRRWSRRDVVLRRYRRMYWGQPAVQQARSALSRLERFDVILANDIDAVGLALSLDPVDGVHADIHEYAPRQNEELLMWRLFDAPYVRWMCRHFLPRAASMTTVGQGIANEYRRMFGVHAEVVTNAAPYAELPTGSVGAPIRIVHSGASLRNRRLETFIDAVATSTNDVTLDLYLMGNDPEYVVELRERAAPCDRISFRQPVAYDQLVHTLNRYDLGLAIFPPTNFNLEWCLPNKFFDYVQARIGLIIGPSKEMTRLVESHGIGVVADDFEVNGLTKVLDSLTEEQVRAWKAHAAAAAHELSSEAQVEVWSASIQALLDRAQA